MSESLDGFKVAAMRQNAGKSLKWSAPRAPRGPAGKANPPGATDCADVIVVSGNVREAMSPHEVAARPASGRHKRIATNRIIRVALLIFFMEMHPPVRTASCMEI
jgi:hypothetical protein